MLTSGDSPDSHVSTPDIAIVEEEYRRIFADPSPPNNHRVPTIDYGPDSTYNPVLLDDIAAAIKDMKPSAPGTDKISLTDLRSLDPRLLETMFNGFLFTGHFLPVYKECRTTLVPKKGDLSRVKNWRPITITSVISRLFSKLLA